MLSSFSAHYWFLDKSWKLLFSYPKYPGINEGGWFEIVPWKMRKPHKLTVLTPSLRLRKMFFFRHQKLVKQHFATANFQLNRCETRLLMLYWQKEGMYFNFITYLNIEFSYNTRILTFLGVIYYNNLPILSRFWSASLSWQALNQMVSHG